MDKYERMRIEEGWEFTGEMYARGASLRGHGIKELGEFSNPSGGWKAIGAPRPEYVKEAETVNELLVAISGLQYLGPSSKIKEIILLMREAKGLKILEDELRQRYTRASRAEDLLEMNGLRVNPKTGMVEVRNGRGRPSPFMTRCIVLLYIALKEKFSRKKVEERIRYLLAHYLPPSVLTVGRISDAIDNFQRKEKTPVDCKRSKRRRNPA